MIFMSQEFSKASRKRDLITAAAEVTGKVMLVDLQVRHAGGTGIREQAGFVSLLIGFHFFF